ncbi:hypothetical protein BH24ACT5_BH24ACT5_24340 [soil metagenome]
MDVRAPSAPSEEPTTVTSTTATFHHGTSVEHRTGLRPATEYRHGASSFTTLPEPSGQRRCRFVTVNDLHFGETEAGRIDDSPLGPIKTNPPGAPPYAAMMNHAAVDEMLASERVSGEMAGVIVKGDITTAATPDEFGEFEGCYRPAFGERLFAVRGNHDAAQGRHEYAGDRRIDLPGTVVALLDTVVPGAEGGDLDADQIDWLDALADDATDPVVVMGHHPMFLTGGDDNPEFVLSPDASAALDALAGRRRAVIVYTAGHTHRHRVQPMVCGVPAIEVGCVKDFPGTWAEYEMYEGGLLQIVHRISSPEALAWSENCRDLYADFGVDYSVYGAGRLTDRCLAIPLGLANRRDGARTPVPFLADTRGN